MTSNNNDCSSVQENIAWGRALSSADQTHVVTCPNCSVVAMQFEEIDSAVNNIKAEIPEGFADRVMQRISLEEKKHPAESVASVKDFFITLFDNPVFRWGLGGTSFLLAFSAH
jgi:hypothetical protein